ASAHYRLAHLRLTQGERDEAWRQAEAAIALHESLRTRVAAAESRASSFASAQDAYELAIELLMSRTGATSPAEIQRALEISERKRARSLLDLLAESTEAITGGVDPELQRRSTALRDRMRVLLQRRGSASESARDVPQNDLTREIQELTAEHEVIEGRLRLDS